MSTRELLISIGIYGGLLAVLARILPWPPFMLAAVLLVFCHAAIRYRVRSARLDELMRRIKEIEGDSMMSLDVEHRELDLDGRAISIIKDLAGELEKRNYQLVEKNIQLLSLKELGLTIISSVDERKVVESVAGFLARGLGFKEFFVSIYMPEKARFDIYTYREAFGRTDQEGWSYTPLETTGMLRKSLASHTPQFIKDPEMHWPGSAGARPLFHDSTMSSYVLVPLLKSAAAGKCWHSSECLLVRDEQAPEDIDLDPEICPACKRFPILGMIGVSDGFKADALSQVDIVSIETLGLQVSSILENTQLYNELKKEEIFRANVIDSMMNGLITTDTQGSILLANRSAADLSGYGIEELLGMSIDRLILSGGAEDGQEEITAGIRQGRNVFQKEMWLARKDGEKLPIVLNTSFLKSEGGEIEGLIAVFFDVTRIKLMEKQIMHLDKLAALGRFSSSIAHEIRNPLAGIAAGIQYIKRSDSVGQDQRENIDFILSEVKRIDRLIGDLMNVARAGDLIYQRTDMARIVRNSLNSLKNLIQRKRIEVVSVIQDGKREVDIDADRITQVLINIIKNAIEASREGGEVTVEVAFSDDVRDVLFDAIGSYVIIKVKDRGVGMRREDRDKVFEPFFSTKHEGTGLGLYVAHSYVERHGGSIIVDSEPGKGTTFSIYVPTERTRHGNSDKVGHSAGR